jgi:hypothetical protein
MNSIDFISLNTTITELSKLGKIELANRLSILMTSTEKPKPEKHNKKDDKTTSHFEVDIAENDLDEIKDILLSLEASSVDENGEATAMTGKYADLLDKWSKIGQE